MHPALRSLRVLLYAVGLSLAVAARAQGLNLTDLAQIYTQAADRAREVSPQSVIAVVDRDARVLLVLRADGSANATPTERALAISKAGTAVFLSSNQNAFSSRSAGFIIQQNFPPGVINQPPGPLVGVGFSNLAFSDVNYFRELDGSRIPGTRLDGSPGGVPLYKAGALVAGIGVTGDGTEQEDFSITGPDLDETVALAGQIGFAPADEILGSHVFIDGIRVSYIESVAQLAAKPAASLPATITAPPSAVTWPTAILGGVAGQLRSPIRDDPTPGAINGQPRLRADEVSQIIASAAARTLVTRAGIRLPAGQPAAVFITVVSNPAQAGGTPVVLGTFGTPDATLFSWDVAVQKARTVLFFSNDTRAYSARTVGFLAQSMYPPGLQNEPPGPFNGLQERFSTPILTGTGTINSNVPNGITIFPGAFPLYRNGVLIGAVGVSGDGVDQDDLIAASGTVGFQPAAAIRADAFTYFGARLPYAKFPRDAELRPGVAATPAPAGFSAAGDAPTAAGDVVNLSARGWVNPGDPIILGFVIADNAQPSVLLRGIGPGLGALGITGNLPDPTMTLYSGSGAPLATNDNWASALNSSAIAAAGTQVGAFGLAGSGGDAGILTSLSTGAYTIVLGSRNGSSGAAMAEVYDATSGRTTGNLKNVSIRGRVDGDTQPLIAGLVIAAGGPRTALIRGVGPSLVQLGVDAPLAQPHLRLFNAAGQIVAEGDVWEQGSNADDIRSTAAALGAFPLVAGASDAVLLVPLVPGAYTIEVTGLAGSAGDVLAEVYAVP